jgi:hypothetical protein
MCSCKDVYLAQIIPTDFILDPLSSTLSTVILSKQLSPNKLSLVLKYLEKNKEKVRGTQQKTQYTDG